MEKNFGRREIRGECAILSWEWPENQILATQMGNRRFPFKQICTNKGGIADFRVASEKGTTWNLHMRTALFDGEFGQMGVLLSVLESAKDITGKTIFCRGRKDGVCTVKDLHKFLIISIHNE